MHREQGDPDFTGAYIWLENEWPSLISEFSPSDVFNAYETFLYFRALPEHTYSVLLVDNCTAHNVSLNLKNIKLVFLPANITSFIQPCDQGIIRTLKAY